MIDLSKIKSAIQPASGTIDLRQMRQDWRSTSTSAVAHSAPSAQRRTGAYEVAAERVSGTVGERQSHTRWVSTDDLAGQLESRRFELKVKTGAVAMHLSSDWRVGLFRQLDNLLSNENWEPIDEMPKAASYSTAMRLLIYLKPTERPGLGLSHDGNILLSWSKGPDHLTIECRANDAVRWIVSNTLDDGTRERAAGDSTAKRVPTVIAAYEPEKWLRPQ